MMYPPVWLKSFIIAELLLQFPFFLVAIYGLIHKKNWIRIPSIMYGTHVATTVLPIIAEILFSTLLSLEQKLILFGFYFPYFAIPAWLALYMAVNEVPFSQSKTKYQ